MPITAVAAMGDYNYCTTISKTQLLDNGLPPDVRFLGEIRGPYDLRGHPGVCSCPTHIRGVLNLSGQSKISDLDSVATQVSRVKLVGQEN